MKEKTIAQLKEKIAKVERFAERLPLFSDIIIDNQLTGEEEWNMFASLYKTLPLGWGLNRGHFKFGESREITNYHKKHDGFFFNVYLNTLTLYNAHDKYGLNELHKKVDVFFYDKLNSTFYCTDEQVEALLDALVVWYEKAKSQAIEDGEAQRITDAKAAVKSALRTLENLDGKKYEYHEVDA